MLESTAINKQWQAQDPYMIVDEADTIIYIGTSINGRDETAATWRIKKILTTGNIIQVSLFPEGSQAFEYAWSLRATYVYV